MNPGFTLFAKKRKFQNMDSTHHAVGVLLLGLIVELVILHLGALFLHEILEQIPFRFLMTNFAFMINYTGK